MDIKRELAEIERQLILQDPELVRKLDAFAEVTPPAPHRRSTRRVRVLATLVCLLLLVVSALAVWATSG